jgi:uncharacterized membrane protein YedE/YeeE
MIMLIALFGGLLIGLAASVAWSGARQIAGISGLLGRLLSQQRDRRFALSFFSGLLVTSLIFGRVGKDWLESSLPQRPLAWLVVSGLLVGFGTQLANGCTSGHGVCGLSRGSPRSLVATLTFMLTAAIVVFLTRHVLAGALL